MNQIIGGRRCKGMGSTIGKLLLILLLLAFAGSGAFIYYTITNSENRIIQEEQIGE